jgi:hypothetical protein
LPLLHCPISQEKCIVVQWAINIGLFINIFIMLVVMTQLPH